MCCVEFPIEGIHAKGGWAGKDGIVWLQNETHQQVDELICPRPGQQIFRWDTRKSLQGCSQCTAFRIGVNMWELQFPQRFTDGWQRTIGILICIQFDDLRSLPPDARG